MDLHGDKRTLVSGLENRWNIVQLTEKKLGRQIELQKCFLIVSTLEKLVWQVITLLSRGKTTFT